MAEMIESLGKTRIESLETEKPPILPRIRFVLRFEEVWQQNITAGKNENTKEEMVCARTSLKIGAIIAMAASTALFSLRIADSFLSIIFGFLVMLFTFVGTGLWLSGRMEENARRKPNEAARRYREKHAARITQLTKDITEFEEGLPYLDVLHGTSGRYEECLERCRQRHARLFTEANELIEGLRNANAVEAAYARLEELKRRMPQLIDGADVDRITKDLTPFVALAEAQANIDDRAHGNVLDASLAVAESSEEASLPMEQPNLVRE